MDADEKSRKPRKLTKKLVESLRTDEIKGIRLYDSELPGFLVTAFPSGRRTFSVRYNIGTSRRWVTLGPFGPLTVEAAREAARQVLSEATLGGDPALDRKRKREEIMPTFERWAADYLLEAQRTRKRPDAIAWNLKRAVAAWRNRRLDTIDPEDVSLLFLAMRKTPIGANRLLATVKACFNAAVRKKLLRENPAAGIEANRENPPRSRVLSDEELGRLWKAIEAEPDPHVKGAFRLLLETGARLGEVLGAKWEDVDLESCRWRLPDPKAGTSQTIVLAESTAEWLGKLPREEDSPFLFPGIDLVKHRADLKKPWERIRRTAELGNATLHDLRRTFGKLVAREAGLHMASALLRHSDPRITAAIYAPMAEAEMRSAVSKVLPFMRRAG